MSVVVLVLGLQHLTNSSWRASFKGGSFALGHAERHCFVNRSVDASVADASRLARLSRCTDMPFKLRARNSEGSEAPAKPILQTSIRSYSFSIHVGHAVRQEDEPLTLVSKEVS